MRWMARKATTVARLTEHHHQYDGPSVIPKLRPVLHGDNRQRRLVVLGSLDHYLGQESISLAADEVAPFLASKEAEERDVARRVLLGLQSMGWLNVLERVADKAQDEKVRTEARQLLTKWNAEHPEKANK
jgi:hypothetical protein